MGTKKDNPITLTAEQVGELRRYHDGAIDRMNRLALLAAVFDIDNGSLTLDLAACLGLASILNELSIGQIAMDGKSPLDVFREKHQVAA